MNEKLIIKQISTFLSDYINKSSQKNFLIPYHDNVSPNSWLVAKLCEQARKTCSAEIYVANIIRGIDFEFAKPVLLPEDNNLLEMHNFAQNESCIIVSPLNKNDGIINRSFRKHTDSADIYPILDLYYSEVIEIYNKLNSLKKEVPQNIAQEEYCYKEDIKNNIISSDKLPNKHPSWFKYTKTQKQLIAKMHQREKATRHKDLVSSGATFPYLKKDADNRSRIHKAI